MRSMLRNLNEINLGLRFKYIHDAVEKIGNQNSKKSDLTFSQVHVICFFCESHEKSISLKDLENEFNLSHPTIIGIVDRLEKKGYVISSQNEHDKRCRLLTPTEKAVHVYKAAIVYRAKLNQ